MYSSTREPGLVQERCGRPQRDLGDLSGVEEPHRRSPESRAAAHIERGAAAAKHSRHVRRGKPDEVPKRPDLTAVCVAGELQAHAELGGLVEGVRVMRE